MLKRTLGVLLIIVLIVGAVLGIYILTGKSRQPLIFSPTQLLGATWLHYKSTYVQQGTSRTIDPSRGNLTTSEGESYTMLRAVWMDDKTTFDNSWNWTKQNLQHKNDHLFSWAYGKKPNGSYGVLASMNGNNTASDADEDIALALVFAYARWQNPSYLTASRAIMQDIWKYEVVTIQGTPYLAADNVEKQSTSPYIAVDPSYLAPEDYRIFAVVDQSHPWNSLVDSSYNVLTQSMQQPLDKSKSANLPPDWISINRTTGMIGPPTATAATTTTNFGFDALRVPWRLALDYTWFHDARDISLLSQMSFLKYTWGSVHAIGETYSHDGTDIYPAQSAAMYGGTIGYFMYADAADAPAVYQNELLARYNPDSNSWGETLSYYDANWAWFGIALYTHLLPNLASSSSLHV